MAVRLRAPYWGIAESIFVVDNNLQYEYKTAKHQSYCVNNVVSMMSNTPEILDFFSCLNTIRCPYKLWYDIVAFGVIFIKLEMC